MTLKKKNDKKLKICVSCKKYFIQEDMIRLVKQNNGKILIQDKIKLQGRGTHICKNLLCVENAIKKNQIKRNLKVQDISEEIYEELRKLCK